MQDVIEGYFDEPAQMREMLDRLLRRSEKRPGEAHSRRRGGRLIFAGSATAWSDSERCVSEGGGFGLRKLPGERFGQSAEGNSYMRNLILVIVLGSVPSLFIFRRSTLAQMNYDWEGPEEFAGIELLAPKKAIEERIPLGRCELIEKNALATYSCGAVLTFAGAQRAAKLTFLADGRLISIAIKIEKADYRSIEAELVRLYGEPHERKNMNGLEQCHWKGRKAAIRLGDSPEADGSSYLWAGVTTIVVIRPTNIENRRVVRHG